MSKALELTLTLSKGALHTYKNGLLLCWEVGDLQEASLGSMDRTLFERDFPCLLISSDSVTKLADLQVV